MYNFRMPLFKLLREHDYEVHIVAPADEFGQRLEETGFTFHPIKIDNKGSNPLADLTTLRAFRQIYRRILPDIVVHYTIKPNIYGTLAAARLGIPSIAITTGLGQIFNERSVRSQVAKSLYKYAFRKPERVLFLNGDDRDIFVTNKIVPNGSITKVLRGEGIDTANFVRKSPLPTGQRSFVLIGRLLWPKGVGEFVAAARTLKAKYPDVAFNILGFVNPQDPTSVSLEDLDQWEVEGIINYLGSTDDVASFIEKTTCVVLPSYYREGVPRTLMEAASMATPIITTDNVGCREVVDHGENGLLVPVKDAEALANAMERIILANPEDLLAMGRAGRKLMEDQFSIETINGELIELFDSILTKSGR
ncbi:hypothetical protein A3850_007300 [Lewinella sp. 4G2]|nr:hypothetical protein A3850_007300 [Lewinella sp. 4G2]